MSVPIDRRAVAAWCLFDWANSAFPAVITTFVFATYFTTAVAADPVIGTALWSQALAIAGLVIAVVSPVLGSVADLTGRRKLWLGLFASLNVIAVAALWFVRPSPDWVVPALVGMAIATVAFEVAMVFYNALLPELAPASHIGRVSGWGWGLGYIGGIVCLSAILVLFVEAEPPPFGLERESAEHVRIAQPFAALWYAAFALPLFFLVPEPRGVGLALWPAVRRGLDDLWRTARGLRAQPAVAWFLLAQMIYADGLHTLFAFGGIYAAGTFGMDLSEVIVFGIALNLTAGLGAFGFAWVDDWLGPKRTIALALGALTVVGAALLVVDDKAWFWAFGLLLGAFFGPAQAASRSLIAHLAPPASRAQMFGLFALSGRITAFLGPAVLGWATHAADSQRAGMATILAFFLAGLAILLWKVPEPAR
ncbi:MAG: MFS transporter [Pseudomonadota bacterium]